MTREQLAALLAALSRSAGKDIGTAVALIDSYGVPGNSWLYQCLLYESEAAVWAAWEEQAETVVSAAIR